MQLSQLDPRSGTGRPARWAALILAALPILAVRAAHGDPQTPPPPAATSSAQPQPPQPPQPPRPAAPVRLKSFTPAPTVALTDTLPDPSPLSDRSQWVYDLRYAQGELYLVGIHRVELAAPQATPRAMGRFALELYEGKTLLERARFDFPMLGEPPPPALPEAGAPLPIQGRTPTFSKVTSRIGVMFPAVRRGTQLVIVDRAKDRRWPLPWPPTELSAAPPATDADRDGGG